ncbi:hypothetical protein GCM10023115_49800 [Pontixanthobacter gangjinensis]|uniref:Uncharacterized protein n=1 Tax=Christiangramia aestuarii TaxID=1028746 RepID=A0A7K1LPJ7_9FLAO|nr:hypothetical protein [Christiangramia aestuarii]MUP42561.1 hypothetical protein [Christiangramia aestuarii]
MADIRIEKKKPIWPWIFLIVVLVVLVFLYFYGSTEANDDMEETEIEEITNLTPRSIYFEDEDASV